MSYIGNSHLHILLGSGETGDTQNTGSPSLHILLGAGLPGGVISSALHLIIGTGTGSSPTGLGVGKLHLITGDGNGFCGEIGHGASHLHILISAGLGLNQTIGSGANILPIILSGGSGLTGTIGSGGVILHAITGVGSELLNTTGSSAVILPMIYGIGSGKATIAQITRTGIVMNISNHSVSHYVNFSFNSLAYFNDVLIGANENGIYVFGGGDDLGTRIEADIFSGNRDLANGGVIMIPSEAWISGESDGEMILTIQEDQNAAKTYDYMMNLSRPTTKDVRPSGKSLGKGFRGRFYSFRLKNRSGANFNLDVLRILGKLIGRKIR